ncbi:MAG TPA: nitric-oxide reductase large subunit, partial [Verrucomicrobiae bacterium]|nr:nitric-oxide reductase large subunit [Verrucomicrobiae bacterium]
MPSRKMSVSPLWMQVALLTFVIGFGVLGWLAVDINRNHPPIPREVRGADGTVLYSGGEVMEGQHLFQRYGLMQYGTLFGHGAYLGPDFT